MTETKTTCQPLINAIITTFPGLPNYSLAVPASTTLGDLFQTLVISRLPDALHASPLRLSPTSGLPHCPSTPLSHLCSSSPSTSPSFLTLRLWTPLCGGKGGFGSQLRAAGGRMSSRKKRGQHENNDSCRNLDGRRMRTVKEAKALAAYLEIKPEMDRKERESRKERWRKVVEAAENREAGESGGARKFRFDDVQWLEATEEERVRTRAAVEKAMAALVEGNGEGSSGSGSDAGEREGEEEEGEEEEEEEEEERGQGDKPQGLKVKEMRFAGWDEDDEFMSSDDGGMSDIAEGEEEEEEEEGKGKGKGKGKQIS